MSRFVNDGIVLEVPDRLLNQNLKQKMSRGKYEQKEARAVRACVSGGSRVLELGGGVGFISSVSAQLTDAANILLVEANPELIPIIKANLALNNADEVEVRHGAVVGEAAKGEVVSFQIGHAFWGSSLGGNDTPSKKVVEVPTLSIFELMEAHQPDVVIMDIEGGEADLFERVWPAHVNHVIMELHPKRYPLSTIKRIVDRLSESGLTYNPDCAQGQLIAFKRVTV